jgi:hypothetical protein
MAHSYPEGFIPLGEAFKQACSASEECKRLARRIVEVPVKLGHQGSPSPETVAALRRIDEYDAATRHIEMLIRNAIADGQLHPFFKSSNGQMEQLIDLESWRNESFGIPDIDTIPHAVTSPGADTAGCPTFLKSIYFQAWLKAHRQALEHRARPRIARKRGAKPKVFDKIKASMIADIHSGDVARAQLADMLQKELVARYGGSREPARRAREAVLSEISDAGIPDKIATTRK